jgi:hypothetical protein
MLEGRGVMVGGRKPMVDGRWLMEVGDGVLLMLQRLICNYLSSRLTKWMPAPCTLPLPHRRTP